MAKTSSDGKKLDPGDVVLVNLDPTVGNEKNKTRPCLVMEAGGSPLELIIVLGITDGTFKNNKTFVPIGEWESAGLSKPCVVDCYQIRAISTKRLGRRIGSLEDRTIHEVRRRLAIFLDIGEEHVT